MCGIAGIVQWNGAVGHLETEIRRMLQVISHRGPDGVGSFVRDGCAFGTSRLAIIDLDTGHQPIFDEDGQAAIVFNGEIYNYRELKAELQAKGHVFHTKSDTEVVLHAWDAWGKESVERLRGMFAFAIFDWRRRVVFLVRDHFGIKPLYYAILKNRLIFASEIQALRVLGDFPSELNLQALDQYLALQYIPAPFSIFRNVLKLSPAHRLLIHMDGEQEKPEKYWSLKFHAHEGLSMEEWVEALEAVIRDSVRAHLVSDVPFGALLSGGLDSTTVVGMMSEELKTPVKTFTIGFHEEPFNEIPYAKKVSKYWNTEHHFEVIRPDAASIMPDLARHYGEPFGDSSAIPTYYVCKLARQFVPMVLSGDGGDEAFAGYQSYERWGGMVLKNPPNRASWKKALRPLVTALLPNRYPPDRIPGVRVAGDWQSCIQYFSPQARRMLWRKEYRQWFQETMEVLEEFFRSGAHYPLVTQAQSLDYATYLPNDILAKVDIASMMHGLEVRTPLVDRKVVEFAASMPPELKMVRDGNGKWIGKRVLKQLLSRHFDSAFVNRTKTGFAIPVQDWLSPDGGLREHLVDRLSRPDAHIYEYFDPVVVHSMIERHNSNSDFGGALWLLLFLEVWMENH